MLKIKKIKEKVKKKIKKITRGSTLEIRNQAGWIGFVEFFKNDSFVAVRVLGPRFIIQVCIRPKVQAEDYRQSENREMLPKEPVLMNDKVI